jgi:Chitobiase/beta-hexosaminidase C-terminal domain
VRYSWLIATAALLASVQAVSSQVVAKGRVKLAGATTLTASGVLSTGPQIASTNVNTISMNGASVYWTTDQAPLSPYSCAVNYGPTNQYGSTSQSTTYGIIGLTGLTTGATYHYSVRCSNGLQVVSSPDRTFTTLSSIAYNTPRTQMDVPGDLGVYVFSGTSNITAAQMGLEMLNPYSATVTAGSNFGALDQNAQKVYHGLFYFAGPPDQHNVTFLPYTEAQAYNAEEINAGRPPILITATYNGVQYPEFYNTDTNDQYDAKQPLFGADPRAARFIVNEYARKTMELPVYPDATVSPYYPNSWFQSDEGGFAYSNFSIWDNTNTQRTITWDQPFPQNDAQYQNMLQSMLFQMSQIGPDVPLSVNEGTGTYTASDTATWANLWGQMGAVDHEGFIGEPISPVNHFYDQDTYWSYQHMSWMLADGKTVIMRLNANSSSYYELAAIYYLLVKQGNSWLNLVDYSSGQTVPPSSYQAIFDALGKPAGPVTASNGPSPATTCTGASNSTSHCLFSRQFEGGRIYLNNTGQTQTVTLPNGTWYLNNSGSPVTSITLPDAGASSSSGAGVYVTSQLGTFVAMPNIYPPTTGQTITGPVSVTLSDATSGAAIHYTTDGSVPTCSSPTYTSPLSLASTTTVSAIGCASGSLPSYAKVATYQVASTQPSVQFLLATDSASAFFPETWAAIRLSNPSASPVTVNFTVTGTSGVTFSPASGSVTFQPFETTKAVAINTSLKNTATASQSITVTLSTPTNATLGAQTTYTYTIQRDNVSNLEMFANLHPSANANIRSDQPTTAWSPNGIQFYEGVYNTTTPEYLRTLWQFDLSSIPSTATIVSAVIKGTPETVTDSSGTNTINVSAYRMTSPWTQSTATWNNSGGNSANYASTPTATNNMYEFGTDNSPAAYLTCCSLDVTADVQAIVNGTHPNYGWVLVGPEATATGPEYYQWFSNNYKDVAGNHIYGPMTSLLVTYTIPNP